jgi:ferritin-like metal-binding protein YciE
MADEQHSLATYVSDMLALEQHVIVPFNTQRSDQDFRNVVGVAAIVERLSTLAQTHIQTLQSALDSLGGHPAHGIKAAFTNIEGWAAGAIDKIRKTKVAKGLRDDYTAVALCTAAYNMLFTTALAFGNTQVAELARRNLSEYAQIIVDIGDILPSVVLQDLSDTGVPVNDAIAPQAQSQIREAWRTGETAHSTTATATTGTIETEAAANRTAGGTYPTV